MRIAVASVCLSIGSLCLGPTALADDISVCFVPGHDCTAVAVREISSARHQVLVEAYELTDPDIADALLQDRRRGVEVHVLVDKSQRRQRNSQAPALAASGMDVRVDYVPGIAHSKVMVIDRAEVLTGSFNWTVSANTRNVENLLTIRDPSIAAQYADEWRRRSDRAEAF